MGEVGETMAVIHGARATPDRTWAAWKADYAAAQVDAAPAPKRMTPRQLACLRLCCKGLTNAQIGDRLLISAQTVKNHMTRAYERLGFGVRTRPATGRAQAMACYVVGYVDGRRLGRHDAGGGDGAGA